jgi:hypothetical protein
MRARIAESRAHRIRIMTAHQHEAGGIASAGLRERGKIQFRLRFVVYEGRFVLYQPTG